MQTPGTLRNLSEAPFTGGTLVRRGSIVLVGASVRAAVESARAAGFLPIAVDLFGDRDTRQSAACWYPLEGVRAGKLASLQRSWANEQIPIAIVGGLQGGYQWIDRDVGLFLGAAPDLFERCDQPEFAMQLAASAGVAFPETIRSGPGRAGWLLKSARSSGGLGVRRVVDRRPIPPHHWMQSIVPGRVYGASYLSDGRRSHLLGMCRSLTKRMGNAPFVYAGSVGPIPIDPSVHDPLQRLGQSLVDRTRIHGPFNLDIVINDDGVTLLEINPRWSASMELIERGWSIALEQDCSMFDETDRWRQRIERVGQVGRSIVTTAPVWIKRVIFADCDRFFSAESLTEPGAIGPWQWKDIPNAPLMVKRHEPLATLIARLDQVSLLHGFRVKV